MTTEELRRYKISKTMRERGINRGSLNPMYKHGRQTIGNCIDCSKRLAGQTAVRCYKCRGEYFRGSRHHNWTGAQDKQPQALRRSTIYKQWARSVFTRDNHTCQACNKRGGKLQAHHDLPYILFPDLRLELLNGMTLCIKCHKEKSVFKDPLYLMMK